MNRKNPGLAELEPITKEEVHGFYLYYATGWTIAAVIYTAFSLWQGVGRHPGFMLGWLMAALGWAAYWYESWKVSWSSKL